MRKFWWIGAILVGGVFTFASLQTSATSQRAPGSSASSATTGAYDLVGRLNDGEHSPEVIEGLVSMGDSAVSPLLRTLQRHSDIKVRGWAMHCLARIGNPEADEAFQAIANDGAEPMLVRTWAAAAHLNSAQDLEELSQRAGLANSFPALQRPLDLKLDALTANADMDAASMIALTFRAPQLSQRLMPLIMKSDTGELMDAVLRSSDANVRRQAASYVATQGQQKPKETRRAILRAFDFDPKAEATPWSGGALWIPNAGWDQSSSRDLVERLLAWHVFCTQNGLTQERQQIDNNLRSVGLTRNAGLNIRSFSTDDLLRGWAQLRGADSVRKMLREQKLERDAHYRELLQSL